MGLPEVMIEKVEIIIMSQSKNFREGPVHILPFKFESAVYNMISTIEPQRQMER